jgi:hypothetical protein
VTIVTTHHRYRRPPRKKPKAPPLPVRIVTVTKPAKQRRLGVITPSLGAGVRIVRPDTPRQKRRLRVLMGLDR